MTKQIIPGDQWEHFFSGLSREYAQKLVTLEMVPEIEGPQLVAFDELFRGISAEEHAGHTTITIRLGDASDLTLETPLRVSSEPFARGGGQVVEIEVADTPLTRLYLSHSTEQSTGRGEIYGGAAERSVGQEAAPGLSYSDAQYPHQAVDLDAVADGMHARQQAQIGGRQNMETGFVSDFGGAAAMGGGITHSESGRTPASGASLIGQANRAPADPSRDYIDQSTRAAGIIGEANTGGGYGPPVDQPPAATASSQAQGRANHQGSALDDEQIAGVRLGIGFGGMRTIGGGSLGDRDLSGRADDQRTELEQTFDIDGTAAELGTDVGGITAGSIAAQDNSDADIVDLGSSAGVIDSTRDPIGGTGDEDGGMDESPNMVDGEVGAQAERDLTELLGKHTGRRDPDDARLQQRLTELIEEEDDQAE